MEQKITKVSKRALWSVYVFIEREVQEGRSVKRRRRLTERASYTQVSGPTHVVQYKFLHLNVTKIFKKNGVLHVQEGVGKKKIYHTYDMKTVVSIQAREHDPRGIVQ